MLHYHFRIGCYNRNGRLHGVKGEVREQGISNEYTLWAAAASLLRELSDTFNRMAEDECQRAIYEDQFGL